MKNVNEIIKICGGFEQLAVEPISLHVEGFMPLSIEQIGTTPRGGVIVSVMHWYMQNGDLMRDPDVEIEILPSTREWTPLSYRQDSIGLFQELGEHALERERLVQSIQQFLKLWDRNIAEQGFVEAARATLGKRQLDGEVG